MSTRSVHRPLKPVYMDYASTTPVDPRVAHKMSDCLMLDGNFGNPASASHRYGWEASELVDEARAELAALINASPIEIVWTSGATESDNLAIKGVAHCTDKNHIITSSYEHKAVLDTCKFLEQNGYRVSFVTPEVDGTVSVDAIEREITSETFLVSIMHANNEIGTVNDVAAIGELCLSQDLIFHVDAAQSVGKVEVDVQTGKIDLLSLSGHKIYGPKGVGALYVRKHSTLKLEALLHGGGHEKGMRSGTLPTHQIVGLGTAARLCRLEREVECQRILRLRQRLLKHLTQIPNIQLNGNPDSTVPGILNCSFEQIDGETLLNALDDIAVSSGSACTSASVEPSHVLRAIGVSHELAEASIRFSFGRFTTDDEIDYVGTRAQEVVRLLRR